MRVDPRGRGNSEGLPQDRTDPQDAAAVVAWLADRPWCTGRVGMIGLGPGGGTALRVAALAAEDAPALAAVVAVGAP